MTPVIRRAVVATGAVLLGSLAAFTMVDSARADETPDVTVSWVSWDTSTEFDLSAPAVADAAASGQSYSLCTQGINAAVAAGDPMPDEARESCESGLLACVHDAVQRGNALTATQFYTGADGTHPLGGYRCVVK